MSGLGRPFEARCASVAGGGAAKALTFKDGLDPGSSRGAVQHPPPVVRAVFADFASNTFDHVSTSASM
jgi:hypothetical protein